MQPIRSAACASLTIAEGARCSEATGHDCVRVAGNYAGKQRTSAYSIVSSTLACSRRPCAHSSSSLGTARSTRTVPVLPRPPFTAP